MKAAARVSSPIASDGDGVDPRLAEIEDGTMPSPGARHRVEFGIPDDERRLLLRISLDGDWSGDLQFTSAEARSAFLDALTSGEFSVVRRRILVADVRTELEIALPAPTSAAEGQ